MNSMVGLKLYVQCGMNFTIDLPIFKLFKCVAAVHILLVNIEKTPLESPTVHGPVVLWSEQGFKISHLIMSLNHKQIQVSPVVREVRVFVPL